MYVELLNLFAISYSRAGEIVGRVGGPTADPTLAIVTEFINSPEHWEDIQSPDFAFVGVAEEEIATILGLWVTDRDDGGFAQTSSCAGRQQSRPVARPYQRTPAS